MLQFDFSEPRGPIGPLLILDRDSTLIVDHGYTWKARDLEFIPGALESLKFAQDNDVTVAIATNQSGLGRGFFSLQQYESFTNQLVEKVLLHGGKISFIATCPHIPEDLCSCRKPQPGLITIILAKFGKVPSEVLLLGNSETDTIAGESAGVESRIATGKEIGTCLEEWLKEHDQH